MYEHHDKKKEKWWTRYTNPYSIMFHIAGIAAIIWFLVRVVPKPSRINYPCQQVSLTTAIGYIAFWGITFQALALWMRKAKKRTAKFAPVFLVFFVLMFSISGAVIANTYSVKTQEPTIWYPSAKDPIGTPQGLKPGRVAWVWNPNATSKFLKGYWWNEENSDLDVIKNMYSIGLQGLTDETSDYEAWDALFKYFNNEHGFGEVGYQLGEKIAIKININNCWLERSYWNEDNDRDASPYVIKALLRQLIDVVGVAEEDITVYDASRKMYHWFYYRTYYESYPALNPVAEFPNVHFEDARGTWEGRDKVEPSNQKIYFGDGLVRTLPTCVTEAKYLINMPLLKRHPINYGVTFSAKNLFGTFIESVPEIHTYHESGMIMGNPTPLIDLLSHEQLGGKTLLYIGDGLFATKKDHKTIAKFKMEPFKNDWTNSLFFSQDPIAMDSVMYDFLYTEGTNPIEGSQNYLHQGAEPPSNTYDPEGDGVYLSESIGVHEHWDTSIDIWDPNRYSGPSGNGIDFVAFGKEHVRSRSKNVPQINNIREFLQNLDGTFIEKLLQIIINKAV